MERRGEERRGEERVTAHVQNEWKQTGERDEDTHAHTQ